MYRRTDSDSKARDGCDKHRREGRENEKIERCGMVVKHLCNGIANGGVNRMGGRKQWRTARVVI